MQAIVYDEFEGPLRVERVADPEPAADGVVVAVHATGVCRSDWHGWQGHDPDIRRLPHVPGHEFAGEIVEIGRDVRRWAVGDRVTIPFVAGCGQCLECLAGDPQVCPQQYQPGFRGWGSFAELVAVRYADFNLVALPSTIDDVTAAALGCRLATAYRAVVLQGRAAPEEWVAVHGCGGVGLSAVMIAAALNAQVIAVDVSEAALAMASQFGAAHVLDARTVDNIPAAILELTGRGANLSLDALGSGETAANSIACLRPRGRHVQVGLFAGADARPRLPMELVIARELQIVGSHGLAAADYAPLIKLVAAVRIPARRLVSRIVPMFGGPATLISLGEFDQAGVTVISVAYPACRSGRNENSGASDKNSSREVTDLADNA